MKTRLPKECCWWMLKFHPPILALTLLCGAASMAADATFTATNWLADVPVSGSLCTNALGQVSWRGNVHVHRVVCSDSRIAGRMVAWMDWAQQPDGTATFCGSATGEPGSWGAFGTNFTPAGGVWVMTYNGVAWLAGSDKNIIALVGHRQYRLVGSLYLLCAALPPRTNQMELRDRNGSHNQTQNNAVSFNQGPRSRVRFHGSTLAHTQGEALIDKRLWNIDPAEARFSSRREALNCGCENEFAAHASLRQ